MRYLLLFLCLLANQAFSQTIDIAQFNPQSDATPAVMRALTYARAHHSKKLVFHPGRYDFYATTAKEQYVFTANNDEGLKRIIFDLSGMQQFEVDGQGAEFVFHGYECPFLLNNTTGISLKNFSIDWARTFQSEARITAVDKDFVDLAISDAYPYHMENGRLVFTDTDGKEMPYTLLLEFDTTRHETAYQAGDWYLGNRLNARELSKGAVRLLVPGLTATPGNVFVFQAEHRLCPAITVADSRDLRFDSLTMYAAGGMGIIAQRSWDIIIDHMRVTRKPGSGRVSSLPADATHFVNCGGRLLIQNSLFENQMDDATNIHGIYVQVIKQEAPATVLVQLKHEQQLGFDFIRPGSHLELVHNTNMEAYDTLVVKAVQRLNKEFTRVEFTKPLPSALVLGKDVLAGIDQYPDVTIRNCVIQKNRARGMLLGSRGKTLLENNYFHTGGAAILFEGDGSFWFEQAGVRDVTLTHNVFDNCNYGVWGNAVIQIGSGVQPAFRKDSRYNRNIRIYENTFNVFDPRLVHAYSVQGLYFHDNKVNSSKEYKNPVPDAKAFEISDCSEVKVE